MQLFMYFVTISLLVTTTIMAPVLQATENLMPLTTVVVMNNLGDGINLFIHCKSKDNDLGPANLANGESKKWHFVNVTGTTLYWCNLKWNNVTKNFQVYNTAVHAKECTDCERSVKQDGIWFYNQNDQKKETWYLGVTW